MTMQYEQRNINLGAGAGTTITTLVYDPDSPQSESSYPDWDTLMAALSTISGLKQIVIATPSPVPTASVTIPPGVYDLTDTSLVGEGFLSLRVEDAVFQNLYSIANLSISVGLAVANTVANFQLSDGAIHIMTINNVAFTIGANATAPIFEITGGTALSLWATNCGFIGAVAGPVITVDATSTMSARPVGGTPGNEWGGPLGNEPFIVVAGGGGFVLEVGTGDTFFAADNPAGPTLLARLEDYEAAGAVGVVWLAAVPRNVKDALDRIADYLAVTGAGPIP